MADELTYSQISEQIQHMNFLKDMPELSEDDKTRVQDHLKGLASRQERKFDNIISMLKKCDSYINALETELQEITENLEAWKKNKNMIVDIIKFAYQQELISNKPTGIKYQGMFKRVKPRLIDNFNQWTEKERVEFGLRKTTTVTRILDSAVVEVKQENIPDRERVRHALANDGAAPTTAELVPSFSFIYERRKRISNRWFLANPYHL